MTARRNHGMTNPAKSLTNPPIPLGTPTSRRPPPGNADVPVGTLLGTPTSRRHDEWKHNEKAGTASRSCLPHWPTRRRRPQVPTGTSALPGRSRMFTLWSIAGVGVGAKEELDVGDTGHKAVQAVLFICEQGVGRNDDFPPRIPDTAADEAAVGEFCRH